MPSLFRASDNLYFMVFWGLRIDMWAKFTCIKVVYSHKVKVIWVQAVYSHKENLCMETSFWIITGNLKQNPFLFSTPGRVMKADSINKSMLRKNRGYKTLVYLGFSHKLSEISHSFIHGPFSDTNKYKQEYLISSITTLGIH